MANNYVLINPTNRRRIITNPNLRLWVRYEKVVGLEVEFFVELYELWPTLDAGRWFWVQDLFARELGVGLGEFCRLVGWTFVPLSWVVFCALHCFWLVLEHFGN